MATIRALKIEPGKHPVITKLESSIESLNNAVSIESDEICKACSKMIDDGVYIIYNAYGFYYDCVANRKVDNQIIVGVFYVIGTDKNNYPRSLTKFELDKYALIFGSLKLIATMRS